MYFFLIKQRSEALLALQSQTGLPYLVTLLENNDFLKIFKKLVDVCNLSYQQLTFINNLKIKLQSCVVFMAKTESTSENKNDEKECDKVENERIERVIKCIDELLQYKKSSASDIQLIKVEKIKKKRVTLRRY